MKTVVSALLGLALVGAIAESVKARAATPAHAVVSPASYQPLEPVAPSPGPTAPDGPSL